MNERGQWNNWENVRKMKEETERKKEEKMKKKMEE